MRATKNIRENEIVGILYGQIGFLTKSQAEDHDVPEELKSLGYRLRLLEIGRGDYDAFGVFSDLSTLASAVYKLNKSLRADERKRPPYLIMHEWCALGRVNSCRGTAEFVEYQESMMRDSTRKLKVVGVHNSMPETSSASSQFIRLDRPMNVTFNSASSYSQAFLKQLADNFTLCPLVLFMVRAVRNIKTGETLLANYEFFNEPNRTLVRKLTPLARQHDDHLESEVSIEYGEDGLPIPSPPTSSAASIGDDSDVEEFDDHESDEDYEVKKRGEKRAAEHTLRISPRKRQSKHTE